MKNFRNTVGSLKKLARKVKNVGQYPGIKLDIHGRSIFRSEFFSSSSFDSQSSNLESKVNSILVAGDLRLYRNVDSKKKKKVHPRNFPKVVAKFLAKHDANWHRAETCRVPLPRLVSPRNERRKEEGEKEKEKERKRERARSVPRAAIDLPPRNFIVHR